VLSLLHLFFFSSRRRHTRFSRDWSSDVCSSDLSVQQVALRAARLGVRSEGLHVLAETDVDAIVSAAEAERPRWLVVDSIQTVAVSGVEGPPGSLVQVREAAARLTRFARETGIPVLLVGHVNKQGALAGPKVLEHAVDAVLYLEGEIGRAHV